MSFVHLHVHSQYSLSSSLVKVDPLIKRVDELGMKAVALTDWANMYGTLHFMKACKSYSEGRVKPIFGAELGIILPQAGDQLRHLVLLAENQEGFKNLSRLVTKAHVDYGFSEAEGLLPRLPLEILKDYSKGLIALSGGLKGVVTSFLIQDQERLALESLEHFKALYGENFFLELQDNKLSAQERANEALIALAKKHGLGCVATCDVHYLENREAFAQEVWMMVSQKLNLESNPRSNLVSAEFYLKSPEEMQESFAHCPEALSNTIAIAERCSVELKFKDKEGRRIYHLPSFQSQGETQEECFRRMCREGLKKRFLNHQIDDEEIQDNYVSRLEREIEIINEMGFAGYFLIVSDFIRWAKSHAIPVGPGRGSGAGSLAAWALDIVELDPIANGLVFERFLNPERVSMPDFDIDFCQARRHEVIQYVVQKYGQAQVCQIVTFAKEQSKNALKDVGRVLGLSFAETNRLTKLIPSVQARPLTIDESMKEVQELNDLYKTDPKIRQVVDLAKSLEGGLRQAGVHAAGVIISGSPIADLAPMSRDVNGNQITQWDMKMSEEAGLVKFDFLGLVTLDLLDLACKHVRDRGEEETKNLQYDNIPIHDAKIYELISKGDTLGVFQLESSGMQGLCTRIKPDCFEDIAAINALFRPGPLESGMVDDYINRKHGREKVTVPFPEMEPILRETYGVILYQEQVMEIARAVGGYTLGGADLLRRAMGKKIASEMDAQRSIFVSGAEQNGKDPKLASELFDLIQKFAGYGFNKSHAAAYAKLAVQSAYLKAKYPAEFFAALLTIEKENTDKLARYIVDARKRGLKILPPDVNESDKDFTKIDETQVRFGLNAVKNVGSSAVDAIIDARKKVGKFQDLFHFLSNVDLKRMNKRMLEALIQCGAFDTLEELPVATLRSRYLNSLEGALEWATKEAQRKESGQFSLFGEDMFGSQSSAARPVYAEALNLDQRQMLDWEKQLLGIYLSASPLDAYEDKIMLSGASSIFSLSEMAPKTPVTVAVLVAELRELRVKRGRRIGEMMAVARLEDQTGQIELISFPDHFKDFSEQLKSKEPLLIRAQLDFEDDKPKLLAGELKVNNSLSVEYLRDIEENWPKKILIKLSVDRMEEAGIVQRIFQDLAGLLKKYPGPIPVEMTLIKAGVFETALETGKAFSIQPHKGLIEQINQLTQVPGCLKAESVY